MPKRGSRAARMQFGEQLCYSACKTDSDPSSRAVAASVRPISQWTAGHGKLKLCAATPASLLPTSCSGKSGAEIFFNQGHSFSQLDLSSKALIYFIVMENGNAALAFHTGGAGLTRRYIVDFELLLSDDATLPQEGFRMFCWRNRGVGKVATTCSKRFRWNLQILRAEMPAVSEGHSSALLGILPEDFCVRVTLWRVCATCKSHRSRDPWKCQRAS